VDFLGAEMDLRLRADYALALVFAERVGHANAWHNALTGLSMIESPLIAGLLADAEIKTKVETLLRVIQKRYRELPEKVAQSISACTEIAQLDRWLDMALEAKTLAQFRQQAGF